MLRVRRNTRMEVCPHLAIDIPKTGFGFKTGSKRRCHPFERPLCVDATSRQVRTDTAIQLRELHSTKVGDACYAVDGDIL